jgi:ATP-dependent Zn protease
MTHNNDEVRAYHEAGHAVIARVLGVGVAYITLFPTDETNRGGAQTRSAAWLARATGDAAAFVRGVETDAKVALAGPHAQLKHRPNTNKKRASRDEWDSDLKLAEMSAVNLAWLQDHAAPPSGSDVEISLNAEQKTEALRIFRRLQDEARALVEAHWPSVERVAKALLKYRALQGGEVDDLIGDRPIALALGSITCP